MATTFTSFKVWADRCIKLVEGRLSSENRFDQREIIRLLRDTLNSQILADWKQAWIEGERTVDPRYITTIRNLEIEEDEDTGMLFTTIPANYVYIYNHAGIQRVVPVDRENKRQTALIPISPYEMDIYQNLPAGSLEGEWCYEPDRDKIWYPQNEKGEEITKKYNLVDMVIVSLDYSSVGDDDQIPIPPEVYKPVTDTVVDIMLKVIGVPIDKKNDNQPIMAEKQ